MSYCQDNEWKEHLLNNVIYSKVVYYKLLFNNGIIKKWLEDIENKDYAIRIIANISPQYDSQDINLIKQYIFVSEEDARKFAACFPYDLSKDEDEMFELRLKLYEKYPDLNHYYMDFKADIKIHEYRTIKYIAFLFENKLRSNQHQLKRYEEEIFIEDNEFLIINGEEVVRTLIKYIPQEVGPIYEFSEWSGKHNKTSIERIVINILKKANKSQINNNPKKVIELVEELSVTSNDIVNELILDALFNFQDVFSDYVIEFICKNFKDRIFLRTTGDGDVLRLVKKIIEKHSRSCNNSLFNDLEQTIISYMPKNAKEYLKRRIVYNKENKGERAYWSFWGDLQLELLSVLPKDRLSKRTEDLLRVLERKFNGENTRYKYYLGHGGFVTSPISGKRLSIRSWLGIITKDKNEFNKSHRWKEVTGGFVESSIEQFASSFGQAVRENPIEMINLVLTNKNKINETFIDSLFSGIANCDVSEIPIHLLEELFEQFPSDYDSYRAQNICRIIEKSVNFEWSNKTLRMLMEIAKKHNNPSLENPVITSETDKEMKSFDLLYSNALNCVRGCAARAFIMGK